MLKAVLYQSQVTIKNDFEWFIEGEYYLSRTTYGGGSPSIYDERGRLLAIYNRMHHLNILGNSFNYKAKLEDSFTAVGHILVPSKKAMRQLEQEYGSIKYSPQSRFKGEKMLDFNLDGVSFSLSADATYSLLALARGKYAFGLVGSRQSGSLEDISPVDASLFDAVWLLSREDIASEGFISIFQDSKMTPIKDVLNYIISVSFLFEYSLGNVDYLDDRNIRLSVEQVAHKAKGLASEGVVHSNNLYMSKSDQFSLFVHKSTLLEKYTRRGQNE